MDFTKAWLVFPVKCKTLGAQCSSGGKSERACANTPNGNAVGFLTADPLGDFGIKRGGGFDTAAHKSAVGFHEVFERCIRCNLHVI